jgi:hypothetical protein
MKDSKKVGLEPDSHLAIHDVIRSCLTGDGMSCSTETHLSYIWLAAVLTD